MERGEQAVLYSIVFILIFAYFMYAICSRYIGKYAYSPPNYISRMLEKKFMRADIEEIDAAALWRLYGCFHAAFALLFAGSAVATALQAFWLLRPMAVFGLLLAALHYPILLWAASSHKYFRKK